MHDPGLATEPLACRNGMPMVTYPLPLPPLLERIMCTSQLTCPGVAVATHWLPTQPCASRKDGSVAMDPQPASTQLNAVTATIRFIKVNLSSKVSPRRRLPISSARNQCPAADRVEHLRKHPVGVQEFLGQVPSRSGVPGVIRVHGGHAFRRFPNITDRRQPPADRQTPPEPGRGGNQGETRGEVPR